jgi:hypothetical protein
LKVQPNVIADGGIAKLTADHFQQTPRLPTGNHQPLSYLYFKFTLSFRDVEIMMDERGMDERGVVVSYESV